MFTKPLTRTPLVGLDRSGDVNTINRLLVAAAISPRFCANLLADPHQALQSGFGGEDFPLTQHTLDLLGSIRVATLSEFVNQLDEKLSPGMRIL
jgi:hypothetical protein